MSNRILILLLTAGLLALDGCSTGEDGRPPSILLISMDTTRSDYLSVYGFPHPTTPHLEALAARGAVFSHAYSPTPMTGPAHASLFTSLYPATHRVTHNADQLPAERRTLAEVLAERGYVTAGVVSSFVLDAKFGLDQGFAFYDDELDRAHSSIDKEAWQGHWIDGGFDRTADETTRRAVDWLERGRDPEAPFFLFVHYFDPHDPYDPPYEFAGRFDLVEVAQPVLRRMRSDYAAEIAFTDDRIGALLAELDGLGLTSRTLVIVTGDHGEGLMQHDYQYHGAQIYEEAVRVPLIFRWPGHIPAGSSFESPVDLLDVMPTILELIGVPAADRDSMQASFQGRSLAQAMLSGTGPPGRVPVFLHRTFYEPHTECGVWVDGEKYGIRLGDWKYIEGEAEGTSELFDLVTDPAERHNVAVDLPDRAADLAARLAAWRRQAIRTDAPDTTAGLSESDRRKLRALGYIAD
jgi:arylsulfatase A-like enzyme